MSNVNRSSSKARANAILDELQGSDDYKLRTLAQQLSIYQTELEAQEHELRDAQVQISHQLEQRELLLDRLPVPYFILDKNYRVIACNQAAIKKATLGSKQQCSVFISGWFAEIDREKLLRWIVDPRNWSEPLTLSLAQDPTSIWRLSIEPFEDGQLLAHLNDVSDLERAQKSLSDSLDELKNSVRFMNLATAAGDLGLWRYRPSKEELEWNERYYELLGTSSANLTGSPQVHTSHWLNTLHPDDKGRVLEELDTFVASMGTSKLRQRYRLALANGTVRWIEQNIELESDEKGMLTSIAGVARDVTEEITHQKELAANTHRLDSAIDVAGLGILELNYSTGIATANPCFCHMYGLPENQPIDIDQLVKAIHPEDAERVSAYTQKSAQTLEASSIEYRLNIEGKTRWCRAAARTVKNQAEEVVFYTSVLDISEDKDREQTLESTVNELQERREKQSQMLSIVGHELRTPVASLKMQVDNFKAELPKAYSSLASSDLDSILSILDDLRFVIQPEAIKARSEQKGVPARVLEQVFGTLQGLFTQHEITPHIRFDAASQQPMLFNTQALRQIATNTLKNAALHSSGQNVWVSLATEEIDDSTNRVRIRFEDDGKGISEEQCEQVFEAFGRGDTQSDGTGLGLFITAELASTLNGSISYFGSEKGGAGFELVCELHRYTKEDSDDDQDRVDPELLEAILVGKQILFAEDQLTIQMLTKAQLNKAGAEVEAVSNGSIALERFKNSHPDIVITDAMMPEMDGYELCRRLRAEGYVGPIIAVTAATIGDESDRLIEAGANVVLPKPLELDRLRRFVIEFTE